MHFIRTIKEKKKKYHVANAFGCCFPDKLNTSRKSLSARLYSERFLSFFLGTAKSQSRTSPRKRRREHDENSPPDNEDQPQPGPSHQIRPPPRRQFAAKSTAGRLQTKDSPANTSGRQASAPAQNTSTQSNTDTQSIPRPGTSGAQAQNSSEQSAQENSSSELIPPYSQARPESPPQSPQRSLSPPSRNLSQMASPSTPDRSPMGAPTAPIPRNRPMRNETPGRPSPPRPNESASGYRQRMADAHRTYNRGTAG